MSTLQELIRYCNDEIHSGALLLTGEMGCGKTYLIEKELSEALSKTHFIVRVSLLGVDSLQSLDDTVRKKWLFVCTPFLAKVDQRKDQIKKSSGLFSAVNSALSSINPLAGNVVSAVVSCDPMDYIPLEPEVEDLHNPGEKKSVVLVFDDLERNKLDLVEIMGFINGYCENKGFKTIIVANEKVILAKTLSNSSENGFAAYKMIKEKTVARTVLYMPDFQGIIHSIITGSKWPSQGYTLFLTKNEELIRDVFGSTPSFQEDRLGKHHNFRSLNCALREFYPVYELLTKKRISDRNRYLYSFITYMLISRNGIYKDGRTSYDVNEEDILMLYPNYSVEAIPKSIQQWIEYGIWEEDRILQDISLANKGTRAEDIP